MRASIHSHYLNTLAVFTSANAFGHPQLFTNHVEMWTREQFMDMRLVHAIIFCP